MRNVPKFINKGTKGIILDRKYVEPLTNAAYPPQTKIVPIGDEVVHIIDFGDRSADEWVCVVEVQK